jgi:hypothetical protein
VLPPIIEAPSLTHPCGELQAPVIFVLLPRAHLTPLASSVLQDITGATADHWSAVAIIKHSCPKPLLCLAIDAPLQ